MFYDPNHTNLAPLSGDTSLDDLSFESLLDDFFSQDEKIVGTVVKGRVLRIEGEWVFVDVGLKAEGRIALREFSLKSQDSDIHVGDIIDIYVERMEGRGGEPMLSREKARRQSILSQLEQAFNNQQVILGTLQHRIKGGFMVDVGGVNTFLPASQLDIRPVLEHEIPFGQSLEFKVIKMDTQRGNIVLSRRALLEAERAGARNELLEGLAEGQIVTGIIKNITNYGAFVDLGGVDGLLYRRDIAWKTPSHPSDLLKIGEQVTVLIKEFKPETGRISLDKKSLDKNPWDEVTDRYPVGAQTCGTVTAVTDYGIFVKLEENIEGLVHVSEMTWSKKVVPSQLYSVGQEVDVSVLSVDSKRQRISLSTKQRQPNPWAALIEKHPVGSEMKGVVKSKTEFGLFVGLSSEVDGMVHISDLAWHNPTQALQNYNVGDEVSIKILKFSPEKGQGQISCGIKQLTEAPFAESLAKLQEGEKVSCVVLGTFDTGLEILINGTVPGFIRRSELAQEKEDQVPTRYKLGETIDATISHIEAGSGVFLTLKSRTQAGKNRPNA